MTEHKSNTIKDPKTPAPPIDEPGRRKVPVGQPPGSDEEE